MKKSFLILLFIGLNIHAYSQSQLTKTSISFALKRTFTSSSTANVGGDLVITDDQPTNSGTLPICRTRNEIQNIYSGTTLSSVFVNVKNVIGNGCVTLVVVTDTETFKETISSVKESGLHNFLRVKSITVLIDHANSAGFPQTIDTKGNVELWF